MDVSQMVTLVERADALHRKLVEIRGEFPVYPFDASVGNIYDACRKEAGDWGERPGTWERKKFIFVALSLMSPLTLAGARLRRGLRGKMARLMGCEPTSVSHDIRDLLFLYRNYPSFRRDVERYREASLRALKGVPVTTLQTKKRIFS